jgi:hypothetical protein
MDVEKTDKFVSLYPNGQLSSPCPNFMLKLVSRSFYQKVRMMSGVVPPIIPATQKVEAGRS